MKWLRTIVLFDQGDVINSSDWATVHSSYVRSIESIEHPIGSGKLKLRRKRQKPDNQWSRKASRF
jgi:hypothetical protein